MFTVSRQYHSRIIWRYVAREFLLAFVVCFLFFFGIFFINVLLVTASELINKLVPLSDIFLLLLYSLPQIVHLSLPFGTLLGAIMSLGRLSADFELFAMQIAGIRLLSTVSPLLVIGALLAILAFGTNDLLSPISTIQFRRVYERILYGNPSLVIEENMVGNFEGRVIVAGDINGATVHNVTIVDKDSNGRARIITAHSMRIGSNQVGQDTVTLELERVFGHVTEPDIGDFDYFRSQGMKYNIRLPDFVEEVLEIRADEKRLMDIWREIRQQRSVKQREPKYKTTLVEHSLLLAIKAISGIARAIPAVKNFDWLNEQSQLLRNHLEKLVMEPRKQDNTWTRKHLFEFHKKLAVPSTCLVFTIFAIPAGLLAPRNGRAYGLIAGMIISAIYWFLLVSAQGGGIREYFSPVIAAWIPNLVVLLISSGMYLVWLWRYGYND